jgi:hypothetical protein
MPSTKISIRWCLEIFYCSTELLLRESKKEIGMISSGKKIQGKLTLLIDHQ